MEIETNLLTFSRFLSEFFLFKFLKWPVLVLCKHNRMMHIMDYEEDLKNCVMIYLPMFPLNMA